MIYTYGYIWLNSFSLNKKDFFHLPKHERMIIYLTSIKFYNLYICNVRLNLLFKNVNLLNLNFQVVI